MPTDRKISQLPLIGTPARTNVLTALDALGANVRGLVSTWLGLTTDADLQLSDVTTNDVSALKHGFAPKGAKSVMQTVSTETGAVSSGATTIPMDDTIPQITEGNQFLSRSITPMNVNNLLKIEVVVHLASDTGTRWIIAALFQDATASALAVGFTWQLTANVVMNIKFTHWMVAGTTSATTFTVRGGVDTSGTTTFNGAGGTRRLGGAIASSITITEYTP